MNARMWAKLGLKQRHGISRLKLLLMVILASGQAPAVFGETLELADAPPPPRVSPMSEMIVEGNPTAELPPVISNLPESLTLEQAMALALRRNAEILRAIAEIRRTEGTILEVQATALPQVNLTSSYSQQDEGLNEFGGGGSSQSSASSQGQSSGADAVSATQGSAGDTSQGQQAPVVEGSSAEQGDDQGAGFAGGFGGGGNENWRMAVEVSQLIYAGGRVGAARRAAVLANSNTLLSLQETINKVLADVVREFYQVVLDRELVRVEQENVDLLTRQLEDVQIRREAEVVADFNVLRARVELANAQPSLIRARNAFEMDKLRLARTLGLDPEPSTLRRGLLNPQGSFPDPAPLPDLEAALATAYRERPQFVIAMQSIQLREAQERVAFSGYLPELSVSGGYELRNSSLSDDLGDTVDGWFLGVNGRWALFDGFRTAGQLKQARAEVRQAELDYLSTRREVQLSVEEAWFQLKTATEVVQSQQLAVEEGQEALRLSRARLDAGSGTQLEVLDTRVAWLRANVTLVQSLYDYRIALAEFRRVTGQISQFHLAVVNMSGEAPLTEASKNVAIEELDTDDE